MMLSPDIYPDRMSGFAAVTGQKSGIPTEIPTKCRDSGADGLSAEESRQISRHFGGIGFTAHLIANLLNGPAGAWTTEFQGLPI